MAETYFLRFSSPSERERFGDWVKKSHPSLCQALKPSENQADHLIAKDLTEQQSALIRGAPFKFTLSGDFWFGPTEGR